jgi:type IV secretion system protein VirB10
MTPTPDNTDDVQGRLNQTDASANGNPYNARLKQSSAEPDLDANAPVLKASDVRRMNRRALGFLAALVVLIGVAAVWMFHGVISRNANSHQPKPREEVVKVPAAPQPPPQQPPQIEPQPQIPSPKTQPIAVTPTLPKLPSNLTPERRGPSLMERRMMDSNTMAAVGVNPDDPSAMMLQQQQMAGVPGFSGTGLPGLQSLGASAPAGSRNVPDKFAMPTNRAYAAPGLDKTSSAQPLPHPNTMMTRGTYIRCVLETHIVTDVPGFTSCIVTEPVYSFTGKRMLLPKGSKVLGQYGQETDSDRVAVIWDRVITPTGIDVNMSSPGTDTLGGAGHPGYLDQHWGERIGAALLISMLSDAFSYEAAKHGPTTTQGGTTMTATGTSTGMTTSPFQSNTAQTLQNFADLAVRRAANRPATIVINQGTVVYIYVAKDIDFSGVLSPS